MALPRGTIGSLGPTFVSARLVSLAVKLSSALALNGRLLCALREPLDASVTLWEATAPVKLPACHCLQAGLTALSECRSPERLVFHIAPPPGPQPEHHRLPAILRIQYRDTMTSYSKAPRGLFV